MRVIVEDRKRAVEIATLIAQKTIQKKPNAVLVLASGKTMVPFYKELVSHHKKGNINFSKIKTFNLDEYVHMSPSDKRSMRYYMCNNFFYKVGLKKNQVHFPIVGNEGYDKEIKKAGGIDLCFLGLGKNAHIAFNEPGSPFNSTTRKVVVEENKREAYSMGIKTIMSAKKIVLIAFGKEKAKAVHDALKEKISEDVPASVLRKHKDATFILDKEAASKL